ncbi:MAG TPA: ABC transporter substrate-binding protein [Candidatus Merdenecus merdavium]|nr:ABC transporter substrate-binding protein [Candidatus Merdenecus merdavium]
MKRKILSALLCAVMVSTMVVGCSNGGQEASGNSTEAAKSTQSSEDSTPTTDDKDSGDKSASGDLKIELVAKGFQHDFWKAVKLGAEKAGEENGIAINFVGPKDESAIAEQVEQLNNAMNKKPNAICLAALDTEAVLGALDKAKTDKIPIIGFDSGVPGADSIAANAATDNYAAGELAAEKLYELIEDKVTDPAEVVRIGVVSQDATSQSIGDRTGGFIDKMVSLIGEDKASVEGHDKYNKKVDDAKVIIEVGIPATVEDAACVTVANTLLNKNDLIAIYGSNEFSAKNIVTANESLQKLGPDKVIGVGFDAGAIQLQAVRDGILAGSVTQDPVQIGYQAVSLAIKAANGESVEDVDTGCLFYTKDNMEDDDIAPCLYE